MARLSAAFVLIGACLAAGMSWPLTPRAAVRAAGARQVSALTDSASFERLFDEYRRGDAAAAVDAFSSWQDHRVTLEARLPDAVTDSASLAALALFLTEAGMGRRTFGHFVEGTPPLYRPFLGPMLFLSDWGLEDIFEPRAYGAHQIIEMLIRRAKADRDARLLDFCRSWYIVAVSYCQRWHLPCVRGLLDKGEYHFSGNDPEYLLLVGSIRQPGVMTRWRMREIKSDPTVGQESIARFERALRMRPDLVEARLRLGHVLFALHGLPEGRRELERALREARASRHQFAAYLGALFLGDLHETAGRMPEAIAHYRMALEAMLAPTASVALTQALARTGDSETAWEVGRRMFGDDRLSVEPVLDPFAIYHAAQYWQGAARVRAMRPLARLQ